MKFLKIFSAKAYFSKFFFLLLLTPVVTCSNPKKKEGLTFFNFRINTVDSFQVQKCNWNFKSTTLIMFDIKNESKKDVFFCTYDTLFTCVGWVNYIKIEDTKQEGNSRFYDISGCDYICGGGMQIDTLKPGDLNTFCSIIDPFQYNLIKDNGDIYNSKLLSARLCSIHFYSKYKFLNKDDTISNDLNFTMNNSDSIYYYRFYPQIIFNNLLYPNNKFTLIVE